MGNFDLYLSIILQQNTKCVHNSSTHCIVNDTWNLPRQELLMHAVVTLAYSEYRYSSKLYPHVSRYCLVITVTSQWMASQIISLTTIYSIVYSGADQTKLQSYASLAFVWGIHRWPENSPHKWPVARKVLPFDDVIMRAFSCLHHPLSSVPSIRVAHYDITMALTYISEQFW